MRVEDLTKFEGECPNIVVFGTYMDIRVPLTKKWKKIMVIIYNFTLLNRFMGRAIPRR